MKKNNPSFPMSPREEVLGWILVLLHGFILADALGLLYALVHPATGLTLTAGTFNLVYYAVSFVLVLLCLFSFMRENFGLLLKNILQTLTFIAVCYFIDMFLTVIISWLEELASTGANPNQQAVEAVTKLNPGAMMAVAVCLAPFVEEALFRGVVFGTLKKHSRILAYAVSIVLFALYHLWGALINDFSWTTVLQLVDYVPGGLALAICYDKSENIYGPIFLHMLLNFVAVTVTIGL